MVYDPLDDYDPYDDYYGSEDGSDRNRYFANPGSALRVESRRNPRNLPCPNCHRKNMLTPADRAKGYQCDYCADALEGNYRGEY